MPRRAAPASGPADDGPEVEEALQHGLAGFAFECRPECGLCCFATPQVEPRERGTLLRLERGLVLESDGDWAGLPLQGPGGACVLLGKDRSCRHHDARPSPCRTYPLHVHLGRRIAVTAILGCPGLAWGPEPGPVGAAPDAGLGAERRWVAGRLGSAESVELRHQLRAEFEELLDGLPASEGRESERAARDRFRARPPLPGPADFPPEPGPSEADGLETLPIFQEPDVGTVALAEDRGFVELLRLDLRGGVAERIGRYPGAERRPGLDASGEATVSAYVRLLVGRDAVIDTVRLDYLEGRDDRPFEVRLEEELRVLGAIVLARARVRAMLRGRPGERLDAADVLRGIRATDAQVLDRPMLGENL